MYSAIFPWESSTEVRRGGHVLPGVVALKPGGLVGHNGVADGVGFVEGVVGKVGDLVIDALRHGLGDAVGGAVTMLRSGSPWRKASRSRWMSPSFFLDMARRTMSAWPRE